jgi:hypothetical protein
MLTVSDCHDDFTPHDLSYCMGLLPRAILLEWLGRPFLSQIEWIT